MTNRAETFVEISICFVDSGLLKSWSSVVVWGHTGVSNFYKEIYIEKNLVFKKDSYPQDGMGLLFSGQIFT